MAAKCPSCGGPLNEPNLQAGNVCFPCQEKKREELANAVDLYYDVEDLRYILQYDNVESVRRLGRKGIIPGRKGGVRKQLYLREETDKWLKAGARLPGRESAGWMKHQNELSGLVRTWIDQLRCPSPKELPEDYGGPGRYEQGNVCWSVLDFDDLRGYRPSERPQQVQMRCLVEDDPLFECLKEHLEGDPVWADYQRFKNEGGTYWAACKKLRELEEDQQLQDELDLERTMQDVEKLDEEVRRAAEKVRDEDHEREDLILEELERIVRRSTGSQIEDTKQEVEKRTRRLTELKRQITYRLREILDMKRLAGTCSRCPGGN